MRNSPAPRVLLSVDQPFPVAPTWTEKPGGGRGRDLALPRDWGLVPWLCWRMCRDSIEVIWGCSRALGKCVPVLVCSSWRNSAPLGERVVLGDVLVF